MISSYFRKFHEATFPKFAGNFLSASFQNSYSCTLLYFLQIVLFYGFQLTDFHETVRQEVCFKLDFMTNCTQFMTQIRKSHVKLFGAVHVS